MKGLFSSAKKAITSSRKRSQVIPDPGTSSINGDGSFANGSSRNGKALIMSVIEMMNKEYQNHPLYEKFKKQGLASYQKGGKGYPNNTWNTVLGIYGDFFQVDTSNLHIASLALAAFKARLEGKYVPPIPEPDHAYINSLRDDSINFMTPNNQVDGAGVISPGTPLPNNTPPPRTRRALQMDTGKKPGPKPSDLLEEQKEDGGGDGGDGGDAPRLEGPAVGDAAHLNNGDRLDNEAPARRDTLKRIEGQIMTMAMNKNSAGGDSTLKAAGDSGMGNALNYDFIRGEGGGKYSGPGQDILAGDQITNKQADANRAKDKPDGTGVEVSGVGQNQEYTQADLEARLSQKGSDKILDPVTYDHGRASLRSQFLLGGEDAVRKTARERMEMDVQFDMFDFVPEGYGLGSHNKMFIQEQNHDRLIRYAEPMFEPRPKDGSELTNDQFDPRLMNQMNNTNAYLIKQMNELSSMGETAKRQKVASVNTLADDNNSIRSSKGLRGSGPSPFEPVIRTRSPWIPTTEPAGVDMRRQLKSIFNTQREPQRHVEYNPHNGMPTLDRRNAMQIILP